jgi:hypothetical protein
LATSLPRHFWAEPVPPSYSLILLKTNIRDNKKNIAFCWFEIKIAIERDS